MNLPLYFERWRFNIISVSGVASQSRTSGCLGDFWTLLLMRSGILRKGLPAQWQSNTAVEAQYRGESPFFRLHNHCLKIYTYFRPLHIISSYSVEGANPALGWCTMFVSHGLPTAHKWWQSALARRRTSVPFFMVSQNGCHTLYSTHN